MSKNQGIMVQVCTGCGACETAIMNELSRLQQEVNLEVVMEECLDTCDDEPSIAVDWVSIAPATPEKLRKAVEMALQKSAQ